MSIIELTHISLFTGIGGIDLAAEWAGFETVLMVENNAYCQKVLKKHWPDVPIIGDIKDVTKERIMDITFDRGHLHGQTKEQSAEAGVKALSKFKSGSEYGVPSDRESVTPITLITGGFPCQPVSQAGKRRGKEDDRWLWPEMLRVISEVRPAWVVAENVTGLLTMGFYDCLSDLEGEGYEVQAFVIPACGVNAPHRRNRIFIVAHTGCIGGNGGSSKRRGQEKAGARHRTSRPSEYTEHVADTASWSRQSSGTRSNVRGFQDENSEGIGGAGQWAVESDVGRVAHGVPSRVDRLKGLGNAVVPQQIYPILQAIADIEKGQALL